MKDIKYCECCGAKLVEYKHGISKSLIKSLYRFAELGSGTHAIRNAKMTISQRTNFQKLRYWGVVEKMDDVGEDGNSAGGFWTITEAGWLFLKGDIKLIKFVWTYRGKRVRDEGDLVSVDQVTGGWKYRPEYAAEATPHQPA